MKNDSKDATKNKPQQLTQGEQLAKALAWILDKASFDEIKLHGSVKWVVVHLVRVAILWVWSSKRLLVESANDAIEKTEEICGFIFIGTSILSQPKTNRFKVSDILKRDRWHAKLDQQGYSDERMAVIDTVMNALTSCRTEFMGKS